MVRTYAVTGDPRYAEYFQQMLDIRNGEAPRPVDSHGIHWDLVGAGGAPEATSEPVALRALMERAGFTPEELALLHRSEDGSNRLVAPETEAMHALEGRFRDDSGAGLGLVVSLVLGRSGGASQDERSADGNRAAADRGPEPRVLTGSFTAGSPRSRRLPSRGPRVRGRGG